MPFLLTKYFMLFFDMNQIVAPSFSRTGSDAPQGRICKRTVGRPAKTAAGVGDAEQRKASDKPTAKQATSKTDIGKEETDDKKELNVEIRATRSSGEFSEEKAKEEKLKIKDEEDSDTEPRVTRQSKDAKPGKISI